MVKTNVMETKIQSAFVSAVLCGERLFAGHLAGLSAAGATVLGAMAGSASYIAAPSAVRATLPDANPTYSLTLALGITFPFNVVLGIPIFWRFATFLGGHA